MSFMNFFGTRKVKESAFHKYEPSTTDEQKKIDSLIKFKNTNGLHQLALHNLKLTQKQVYDIMLGDEESSFIYHFNTDLMIYFLHNHQPLIYNVLSNMFKEIASELLKEDFAEYKNGFVVSPSSLEDSYGKWLLFGNFLQNPGFQSILIEDTKFALYLCDEVNNIITAIRDKTQILFNENRRVQSSMSGILEQAYIYNEQVLSLTIREIYENAQQKDVLHLIGELSRGENSVQKSKIIERVAETVKNFDLSELPPDALKEYEEIKALIIDLEPHRDKMPEDMKLLYERLVDIRLIEIMEQYIILPKKFLERYKDREDSPQNLITKSLKSMEQALIEIHTAYFNKKMLDLHATQVYMEEIGKS